MLLQYLEEQQLYGEQYIKEAMNHSIKITQKINQKKFTTFLSQSLKSNNYMGRSREKPKIGKMDKLKVLH
jgi:hypothetical protein